MLNDGAGGGNIKKETLVHSRRWNPATVKWECHDTQRISSSFRLLGVKAALLPIALVHSIRNGRKKNARKQYRGTFSNQIGHDLGLILVYLFSLLFFFSTWRLK